MSENSVVDKIEPAANTGASTARKTSDASTDQAREDTILSPHFYTTDFDAMDKFSVESVREEWDALMAEFKSDTNREHFVRSGDFIDEIKKLPPELHAEFVEFLISSVTSEFSGCVLYSDVKKHSKNADIKELMGYMARDESRHAGFINHCLKDFGIGVDLGFLRKAKKYKFFRPKFILYATYLSEKIGYARYIAIYRQLEAHPEKRFHPIFRWFKQWCNDEFRHGDALALMMRANPELLTGMNRLWIRFFLCAVYATMYVRDHQRPVFHKALGVDITEYDMKVFEITSTISEQVFPFSLDTANPKFQSYLDTLFQLSEQMAALDKQRTVGSKLVKLKIGAQLGLTFVRLYMLPVNQQSVPKHVRLTPAW